MLEGMTQPSTETTHNMSGPTFAGLMAAISSAQKRQQAAWKDEELQEDVATLSYERALRTHARMRPADPEVATPPMQAYEVEPLHFDEAMEEELNREVSYRKEAFREEAPGEEAFRQEASSQEASREEARAVAQAAWEPMAASAAEEVQLPSLQDHARALERELKCASITIRMSQAESEQLRKRAAEAGLTISAYLRSCTFEAESLRAMVKDTMAQLRLATARAAPTPAKPDKTRRLSWLERLMQWWHAPRTSQRQHAARA
jgi:hypothetical protein